jgi:hypothetical protein
MKSHNSILVIMVAAVVIGCNKMRASQIETNANSMSDTSQILTPTPSPTPTAMGPLTISTANSRYFATPDGKPVYLTGIHNWANLQEVRPPGSTETFDYIKYVNVLQANKHNLIRLWINEASKNFPPTGLLHLFIREPAPATPPMVR